MSLSTSELEVRFPAAGVELIGHLTLPDPAIALVAFAHGSGSSRLSPRNQAVARTLHDAGLGTLLFDLLTPRESESRAKVFDLSLLADRLLDATGWLAGRADTGDLPLGYFGASTGAGAALIAAARAGERVRAVVSRGGRPDLAGEALRSVGCPTLLIVGGFDRRVLELNRWALERLAGPKRLEIVPGAGHLFEEPGTLEQVGRMARDWFAQHLPEGAA